MEPMLKKSSAPGATAEPVTISTSCATNIRKDAENAKTEQRTDTKRRETTMASLLLSILPNPVLYLLNIVVIRFFLVLSVIAI